MDIFKKTIIGALIIFGMFLFGCEKAEKNIVFHIGDTVVTDTEYKAYLLNTKDAFTNEGGMDIWGTSFDGTPAPEKAKEVAANSIISVKVAAIKAKEQGVSLTDNEVDIAKNEALLFLDELSDENKEFLGDISETEIIRIMEEKALYMKMYDVVTKKFTPSTGDFKSYFNQYKKDYLTFHIISFMFYDDMEAEAFMEAYDKKDLTEAEFEELISALTPEQGIPYGNMLYKKGMFDNLYDNVIFNITSFYEMYMIEEEDGYHVTYIISRNPKTDEELHKKVEQIYIEENKNKIFSSSIEEWQQSLEIERNDSLYNEIFLPDNMVTVE